MQREGCLSDGLLELIDRRRMERLGSTDLGFSGLLSGVLPHRASPERLRSASRLNTTPRTLFACLMFLRLQNRDREGFSDLRDHFVTPLKLVQTFHLLVHSYRQGIALWST